MISKIIGWFTGLDVQGKIIMIFVFLGLVGIAIATAYHLVDTLTETATEAGAQTERAATQGKALDHVGKAKAAAREYRNNPDVRDADCLLDATNPEDC